jgi:glycosyltransferase involved in cell wall biosynthesis
MKIVAITDKKGSAIDRLARLNAARLEHLQYIVCPLHPKRPSPEEIRDLEAAIAGADLVDAQYWKSAVKARELGLGDGIPWVLTHQNEHNIKDTLKDHWSWKERTWAAHVCKNKWQRAALKEIGVDAHLIQHAIDFENFKFVDELTDRKVVGYVGQVKKVKGVREIAQACTELGYKLLIVGSVSEADYWTELQAKYPETIETFIPGTLHAPDNMIGQAYARMRVYCANSDDGTESGTMPILEAMLSGIPVVARRIGLVRDVAEHGKNMWIREGKYTDIEDLKRSLKMVMENDDITKEIRENAWRAVRQYHPDRQAREYEILFRKVLFPGQRSVSVIMPTSGRNELLAKNIAVLDEQTYKNFELVVCDDNQMQESLVLKAGIEEIRKKVRFPIRRVWTRKMNETYGLAKARNVGLIEATGDIVVFCDDRLKMHPAAIAAFVTALTIGSGKVEKRWLWGSKGTFKTFVENFSATWRRVVIDGGMFNERIDCYGGMTQEISSRFGAQGIRFDFCPQALAEPMIGTHSKSRHREDIIRSKVRLYKMGFQ